MRALRYVKLLALDALDVLTGSRPDLVPPRREIERIGGGDFVEIGRHLASIAVSFGGLQAGDRVLDVGCGFGRVAVALAAEFPSIDYLGFDIDRRGIHWCQTHIGTVFPSFRFTHVDVRSAHYNPRGRIAPEDLVIPASPESFDLVLATSLFTHLNPPAADHYLAECARVLRPGGRLIASFFLLTGESRTRMANTNPSFIPVDWYYAVQQPDDPEAAIAFDESALRETLQRHGIPAERIEYGNWCFRAECLSFQDFVRARKGGAGQVTDSEVASDSWPGTTMRT